jgi:hypothetical protein
MPRKNHGAEPERFGEPRVPRTRRRLNVSLLGAVGLATAAIALACQMRRS